MEGESRAVGMWVAARCVMRARVRERARELAESSGEADRG